MRHDEQRGRWVILAPERVLLPDEISVEILQLCDGTATVDDIAAALAQDYSAPVEEIRADVIEVLQNLIDKGFLSA
jgi:pyrroloquinoline quinone biosynthesis protein D